MSLAMELLCLLQTISAQSSGDPLEEWQRLTRDSTRAASARDIAGFGATLASVGDIDGDGASDFACSMPFGPAPRVWILSGRDGQSLRAWKFEAAADATQAWLSLAGAQDFDGDGRRDLWIGVKTASVGELRLCSSCCDQRLDVVHSKVPGFGAALRADGDIDGDGVCDPVVGSFRRDKYAKVSPGGSITVISGATRQIVHAFSWPDKTFVFGESFDASRDLDRDGKSDVLAVAVRGTKADADGDVVVYSGAEGRELLHLRGAQDLAANIRAACYVDDRDDDGVVDIAIAIWVTQAEESSWPGRLRLFSGATGKSIPQSYVELPSAEASTSSRGDERPGPFASGAEGFRLLPTDDLDGDGCQDLIVGEPGADWGLLGACGLISIASLERDRCIASHPTLVAPRELGYAICRAGDFDHDGVEDILASAPDFVFWPGVVYAYSGRDLKPLRIIDPEDVEPEPEPASREREQR